MESAKADGTIQTAHSTANSATNLSFMFLPVLIGLPVPFVQLQLPARRSPKPIILQTKMVFCAGWRAQRNVLQLNAVNPVGWILSDYLCIGTTQCRAVTSSRRGRAPPTPSRPSSAWGRDT